MSGSPYTGPSRAGDDHAATGAAERAGSPASTEVRAKFPP
jgi:hypothetical protein